MDVEAIEKIENLVKKSLTVKVGDREYSTYDLSPVLYEPKASPVGVSTLTGFVDFVNRNIDNLNLTGAYIAVVRDCGTVALESTLSPEKRTRECLLAAELDRDMEGFPFGIFMPQEEFIIKLHSLFERKKGDDFDYVSTVVSKIQQSNSAETEDDGITQRVTVKKSVSGTLVGKETVKPIVTLSPYRTFREIEQPESRFLLRINCDSDEPKIALFEADGGQWRNEARIGIAEYLKSQIGVSVIA